MEFRELSTFLQVAKLQSFSKAAKVLGYSQAAVTIQIKQLEQELGVHLFDRIGKQIVPHQGQQFRVGIHIDFLGKLGINIQVFLLPGVLEPQ